MLVIKELALIRLAIAKLSEASGWIPSLGSPQVEMLKYILPRTAPAATIQLAYAINARQHDEQVGAGHYHLFRLRADLEERLRQEEANSARWNELAAAPPSASRELLERLATGVSVDYQQGPVSIGALHNLTPEAAHQMLAYATSHYLAASQQGYRTYPYLTQE